jgi:DNA phosphorothioation-associated putative methyltransferase
MRRTDLSIPAQHLMNMGIFKPAWSYFDYGCGRGDDVAAFKNQGLRARGWDPVHSPKTRKVSSDIVGCHYVINVIDRPEERRDVVRAAWELSTRVLLVSARLEYEQDESHAVPKGDGWITSKGTFQKFYSHEELGDFLTSTLDNPFDAVAPGIYASFREASLRQEWKALRLRTPSTPRLSGKSMRQLQENRDVLEPMIQFVLDRGRLPQGDELENFEPVVRVFGSPKMAFQVVARATDRDAWHASAVSRSIELLAFLALAQFDQVDRMNKLSPAIQRDVRAHYGSFKSAHSKATALLFASGNPQAVDLACRASRIGKLTPTALYLHRSAINELPALLRVVLGCAQRLVGDIPEANVIKIFRSVPEISFLEYPEFDSNPHPWLNRSWHLDLQQQRLHTVAFGHRTNRPILHRLHDLVSPTHPQFSKWREMTLQEEEAGMYADPSIIGTEEGWALVKVRHH